MKYEHGRYAFYLSLGYANSDREEVEDLADYFCKDVWEAKSEEEQEEFMEKLLDNLMANHFEAGWYKLEG